MRTALKTSLPLALSALLFLLSNALRIAAKTRFDAVRTDDDRFYLPPAGWLRLFSLGFNEAMADLIWIKTILYFGENIREKGEELFVMNYIETAVDLDPRFNGIYVAGSFLTLYQNRGQVSRKSVDMAIRILERGIKAFPDDGNITFNLGFMHYSELAGLLPADPNDKETRYHEDLGRRLIGRSALMPGAPPYATALSVALFQQEGGMNDLVVAHLQALLAKETIPEIRQTIMASLRKALGEAAERDIAATNQLQSEWRTQMPYVSFDLYTLLRPATTVEELVDPLSVFDRILGLDDEARDAFAPSETN